MRALHVSLLASVFLNGLLAAAFFVVPSAKEIATEAAAPASPAPEVSNDSEDSLEGVNWAAMQEESLPSLVARLRAEGFPPEALRSIVRHRLDAEFEARRAPYQQRQRHHLESAAYKSYHPLDPELVPGRRAVEREYAAALEALLGPEAEDPVTRANIRREFGELPPAKIAQIKSLKDDYAEMAEALRAATRGVHLPEDEARLAFLEEEKRADLAALLSPEEMLAYDLRASATAHGLRNQLQAFTPSEEEFITLFRVQRDVERELAALPYRPTDEESRELRERRVQEVLSPARFEEYQIRTSGSYSGVRNLVRSLDLPESTISDVIRTERAHASEAHAIRANAQLTTAERDARLAEISQRARERLAQDLGATGLSNYLFTSAGKWLAELPTPPSD